jgi:hypothetical protein
MLLYVPLFLRSCYFCVRRITIGYFRKESSFRTQKSLSYQEVARVKQFRTHQVQIPQAATPSKSAIFDLLNNDAILRRAYTNVCNWVSCASNGIGVQFQHHIVKSLVRNSNRIHRLLQTSHSSLVIVTSETYCSIQNLL